MENANSVRKTHILYFVFVCIFVFQSLTWEDDDKMTFERYVHLQLNLLPLLSNFSAW